MNEEFETPASILPEGIYISPIAIVAALVGES